MNMMMMKSLHVSSTSCPSSGETNCVNTISGSRHSVSVAVTCAHDFFLVNIQHQIMNNYQISIPDETATTISHYVCLFVFLALHPIVVVFLQPSSGL